jgi:hypothetical protein
MLYVRLTARHAIHFQLDISATSLEIRVSNSKCIGWCAVDCTYVIYKKKYEYECLSVVWCLPTLSIVQAVISIFTVKYCHLHLLITNVDDICFHNVVSRYHQQYKAFVSNNYWMLKVIRYICLISLTTVSQVRVCNV